MIIKSQFAGLPYNFWTDEAVAGLVGQKVKFAGCLGNVIHAYKTEDGSVSVEIEIPSAFQSYLIMKALYGKEDIVDDLSISLKGLNHGQKDNESST